MNVSCSLKLFVVLLSLLNSGFCGLNFGRDKADQCKKPLDGLVVTWAPPGANNPWAFSNLPRTKKDAETEKWTKLDDGCENSTLKHKGQRYLLNGDKSVLVIFDQNGYVAGVQRTIPKALADTGGVLNFTTLSFTYQDTIQGEDRYMFTTYFVDPKKDTICKGRTASQFKTQGTKSQVYIQNGPDSYLKPPNTEDDNILKSQNWTKGLCVKAMGQHYYLEASEYQSCTDQKPYFLTYDCGRLVSVGMFVIGNFTAEPRYEFVPENTLKMFIDPVPRCLYEVYKPNTNGITSMHMFFTSEPKKIPCPEKTR